MNFTLHPRLAADTHFIKDLPLCKLLMMDDARFPWLILVPRVSNACELFDLSADHQASLMQEINSTSRILKHHTQADKINVAALGNQVPQLHVHIIARTRLDSAWPQPVWNSTEQKHACAPETVAQIKAVFAVQAYKEFMLAPSPC